MTLVDCFISDLRSLRGAKLEIAPCLTDEGTVWYGLWMTHSWFQALILRTIDCPKVTSWQVQKVLQSEFSLSLEPKWFDDHVNWKWRSLRWKRNTLTKWTSKSSLGQVKFYSFIVKGSNQKSFFNITKKWTPLIFQPWISWSAQSLPRVSRHDFVNWASRGEGVLIMVLT